VAHSDAASAPINAIADYLGSQGTPERKWLSSLSNFIHSVLSNCAQFTQGVVTFVPLLKLILDGSGDFVESVEIAIVQAQASDQLPDPFDRVEIRTVGRQKVEGKAVCARSHRLTASLFHGLIFIHALGREPTELHDFAQPPT
jgi:hypothetical protein